MLNLCNYFTVSGVSFHGTNQACTGLTDRWAVISKKVILPGKILKDMSLRVCAHICSVGRKEKDGKRTKFNFFEYLPENKKRCQCLKGKCDLLSYTSKADLLQKLKTMKKDGGNVGLVYAHDAITIYKVDGALAKVNHFLKLFEITD